MAGYKRKRAYKPRPRTSRRAGRQTYIRGQGFYHFPASFISRGTFRKYGRKMGSWAGGKSPIAPGIFSQAGGALGAAAGSGLAKLLGTGDYMVKHNTLIHPKRMVPSFGKDSIRIRKRELIAIVDSTDVYSNIKFPIQPGSETTFPWLSRIAANYEQYSMNGCVFQFHSTSSDSIADTTNLGLGTVALVTDYNAADAPYVNMIQALGSMFANSGKPSEDIFHAIECKPTEKQQSSYYIRTGDVPAGSDIRLNDMGNFQFIVDGVANYTGMGQLWVSYDITLFKSVQNNLLGLALNTDRYDQMQPTAALPLGATRVANVQNDIGTSVTSTKLSFPPTLASGYYFVHYYFHGTGAVNAVKPVLTPFTPAGGSVSCAIKLAWNDNTQSVAGNINGHSAENMQMMFIVQLLTNNAAIDFGVAGTLPPTVGTSNGTLDITQVNGGIYMDLDDA